MAVAILTKKWKTTSLTDLHRPTLLVLPKKTANIIKQNWNQLLLVVKATALKQQISNFYLQILSTQASFYIYDRPVTGINVIASVCALNLQIKNWYLLNCCFRAVAFTTNRNWFQFCFTLIIIIIIQAFITHTMSANILNLRGKFQALDGPEMFFFQTWFIPSQREIKLF